MMKSNLLTCRSRFFLITFGILFAFTSCKNDRSLADGGWLQKRRYEKGYHLNLKSGHQQKETDNRLAEKAEEPPLVASLDAEIELSNTQEEKSLVTKAEESRIPDYYTDNAVTKAPETIQTTPKESGKSSVKKRETVKSKKYAPNDDYHAERKLNTLALLSFIFAIASFFILGIPFGIAAVVCGVIGLSQCEKNPEGYSGKGFAIVGIIIGLIAIVLVVTALSTM